MSLKMKDLIRNAIKESDSKLRQMAVPDLQGQSVSEYLAETEQTVETLKALMTTHTGHTPQRMGVTTAEGKKFLENWQRGEYKTPLKLSEALHAGDASILFKRVISDVLMLPKESTYWGQTILARTIRIDGVKSAMFPALGAIRAGDVTDTGDYPEQQPSFTEHMLDLKVQKSGVKLSVAEDVIDDSQWDIFGIYVTMASAAMDRWKEEKIFNEAMRKATAVFDNSVVGDEDYLTNGRDRNGNRNGSVSFTDLMDILGGVLANGYTPTDIVLHPLTWVMLAKDPRLLFHLLNGGNYQSSVPMPGIDAQSIQKNLPFGSINVVVTPQMPFAFKQSLSIDGVGTLEPANIGSILALERQASLVVLQRDDKEMEEFKLQDRDIHVLKCSERYAVGALDEGRGMAIMKNIRLVQNHESVFNVGMGTVS